MNDFQEHRKEVIDYIIKVMINQGALKASAVWETTCIFFWKQVDVENLYRCINSDLPENVKRAIVAHDFNGLANKDKFFTPKSVQFGVKKILVK